MTRSNVKTEVRESMKCDKCGNLQTVGRRGSRQKKVGHKKYLWCVNCSPKTKKKTLHKKVGVDG